MAESKWKYASLPASERLRLVTEGNPDVYNTEMSRTEEVIKAREKAGLDTSAQVKWANELGYNYNLQNAEKMGIPKSKVNKTGYGEALTATGRASSSKSASTDKKYRKRSAFSDYNALMYSRMQKNEREIRKAYEKFKSDAKDSFEKSAGILRESLINSGAGLDGGKMISEELGLREALANVLAKYDSEMESALSANRDEYKNAINSYRKSHLDIANSNAYKQALLDKDMAELELKKQSLQNDRDKWEAELDFAKDKEENSVGKWQAEYDLDKFKEQTSLNKWQAEFDFDKGKEATDNRQWQAEFDFEKEKEAQDHDEWLSEFGLKVRKEQTDYDIWYAEQYGTK